MGHFRISKTIRISKTSVTSDKKSPKSSRKTLKASSSDTTNKKTDDKAANKKSTGGASKDSPSDDSTKQINEGTTKIFSSNASTEEASKEDINDSETETEDEMGFGMFDNYPLGCPHQPEITGTDNKKVLLLPEEHYLSLIHI